MWNLNAMQLLLFPSTNTKKGTVFFHIFSEHCSIFWMKHTGRIFTPTDFGQKSWCCQRWCHGRSAWVHKDRDIQSLTGMASRQSLSGVEGLQPWEVFSLTTVGFLHVSARLWTVVVWSVWSQHFPSMIVLHMVKNVSSTKCFSPGLAISPRTIVAVPLWPSRQRLSAPSRKGAMSFVSLGRNSLDKETHLFCVFWTNFPNRFQFSGG